MTGRFIDRVSDGFGSDDSPALRVRIFRLVCATTAALCIGFVMPMNLAQSLPVPVHLGNIALGLLGAFCYWQSCRGRTLIGLFLGAALLALDIIWFFNAGSQGSVTFYFLPVLLFSMATYPGRTGWLLAVAQVLNLAAIFALEQRFPGWITPFHSDGDRIVDLITGLLAASVATALIASLIVGSHHHEQRRLAESAARLATSERSYREIFNATSDAMFVHAVDGRLVDLNDRACALFNFDRATGMRLSFNDCSLGTSPYSAAEAREKILLAVAGTPQVFEWRSRCYTGELFWSEVALRMSQIDGAPCVIAAVRDISARKRAQHELMASEERLRLAMHATQQGWFELDVQTGVGFSSPEYIRILGYEPATFSTSVNTWIESVHPDDREPVRREFLACIESGDTRTMEYRRRTASGAWKWVRSVGRIVERDKNGRPLRMMGTHADITERKELQQQLLHSQRLEAVGTLASGVAHDLNNTLTPMLMAAGFLRQKLADADDRELMSLIEAGGQRSAAIVKQLLAFSRNIASERRAVDPRQVVREIAAIMRSTLPKEIALVVAIQDCPLEIEGDVTQLHQVVMNLCVNARDAMPGGGTLTLGLEETTVPARGTEGTGRREGGPHVVLTVTDTGQGIPPEIRDKIFDPFFTTKSPGKGTGLGLASVHGIVTAHEGFVRVESEPGRGATFRVYLPARPPTPADPAEDHIAPPEFKAAPGAACIMVVDDEPSVLKTTQRLLASRGYKTLGASSGADALRLLRENRDRVNLVITDFMMPEMDGATLLPLMRQIVPGLKVIGVSGLDQRVRSADLGFSEVLCKPYDTSTLLPIVSRLLQEQ